jgi:hypothetical protein
MKQSRVRTTVPLAVAAVALVLSGAGGAVAGSMITGAQIKDGTITTTDVKDRTLRTTDLAPSTRSDLRGPRGARGARGPGGQDGADGQPGDAGVLGYEVVTDSAAVAAGYSGHVFVECPAAKRALGGAAYRESSNQAVQLTISPDGSSANAYAAAVPGDDTVVLRLICATAS